MPDTSANKIKFGLSNVYYAVATIAADGSATYGTPVRIPGAVNLSMDPQGENTPFYADNIVYYTSASNAGYEGDLEVALVPDSFKKDVLGYAEDTNGVLYEDLDAPIKNFALLFQFEGDIKGVRHVLYNCTATRPGVASGTKTDSTEPTTETMTLTATSVYVSAIEKNVVKSRCTRDQQTQYDGWFTSVYTPAA